MKSLVRLIGAVVLVGVLALGVMARIELCPPQGPWPQPPWCAGSSINWPFSDSSGVSISGDDAQSAAEDSSQTADTDEGTVEMEEDAPIDSGMSENERLAWVAIGLVEDLSTVNTYFNDAGSSFGNIQVYSPETDLLQVRKGAGMLFAPPLLETLLPQGSGEIPSGFLDPLPMSGYIPAPEGACAVGASPSASFLNKKEEKITPDLMSDKNIQVIGFDELTGGTIQGRKLEETIRSLIKPGDMDLATAEGWNNKVWNQLAVKQTSADSLMDYYLWSVSDQIEAEVVGEIAATLNSMGLPSQVMNAFQASRTSGWYANQTPGELDLISAMEIEAVFSGRTEGTIYEKRDFSLPVLGEMPVFGPMTGEGSVVYHDPDYGDYPFDLELDWNKWDELGRVTAGELLFTDHEHGAVIKMTVNEDNSRVAHVHRDGVEVGIVNVTSSGEIIYQDLTE